MRTKLDKALKVLNKMPTYKMCLITVNYNPKKIIQNVNKDVHYSIAFDIKILYYKNMACSGSLSMYFNISIAFLFVILVL